MGADKKDWRNWVPFHLTGKLNDPKEMEEDFYDRVYEEIPQNLAQEEQQHQPMAAVEEVYDSLSEQSDGQNESNEANEADEDEANLRIAISNSIADQRAWQLSGNENQGNNRGT